MSLPGNYFTIITKVYLARIRWSNAFLCCANSASTHTHTHAHTFIALYVQSRSSHSTE